jgi:2-methylcitrate dehydratase PrpD
LTAKGQTFSEDIAAPKGTVENPLTEAELLDKFRNNASFSTLSANKVEAIIERVADLEKLEDVTDLTRLLTIC